MASPQITVRVDPELYKALVMLARVEEKTLANFTRDLIEDGLKARKSKKSAEVPEILERLDAILDLLKGPHSAASDVPNQSFDAGVEARLTDLVLKAIRAAAASQFYARQAAIPAQDVASIWADQINASETSQNRRDTIGRLDADSQEFAQWWVKSG